MDLDSFVVLTTGNLRRGYWSWQAAEIQITQAHAGGVHFEQHRRDDTWLSSVALALCALTVSLTDELKVEWTEWRFPWKMNWRLKNGNREYSEFKDEIFKVIQN